MTKKNVLVVAPHPDDETLGCGGTLLRHADRGDSTHWLIVTSMDSSFSAARRRSRKIEVRAVAARYRFSSCRQFALPAAGLDQVPTAALISRIAEVFDELRPDTVYAPHESDVHSDHRLVSEAVTACSKSFRAPFLRQLLAYEVLSETGYSPSSSAAFVPNVFIDITETLERKIDIMRLYKGELGAPPFPRSELCIRSLASLRGSHAGLKAAEAFMLRKEIRCL